MVQVTTNAVIKINVITVVARLFGLYDRRGGPDYQAIQSTRRETPWYSNMQEIITQC